MIYIFNLILIIYILAAGIPRIMAGDAGLALMYFAAAIVITAIVLASKETKNEK